METLLVHWLVIACCSAIALRMNPCACSSFCSCVKKWAKVVLQRLMISVSVHSSKPLQPPWWSIPKCTWQMNESPLCDHLACTLHVNMHSRNRNYDGCYFSFRQWKQLFQELQPHSLIVYVDGERAGKVLCFQTTRYYVCDGILITKRMLIPFSLRLLCFFPPLPSSRYLLECVGGLAAFPQSEEWACPPWETMSRTSN